MYSRTFRARFAFALTSLLLLGAPAVAAAAGEKDAEAIKLHDQAMDEDYLSVEFDKAEKKLRDALKKCGKDSCTAKVVGKLHIALGTVLGGGGKLDQAKDEFVAALNADPKAALIDALTTTELAKAFKDAQKEAGSGGTPGEEPGGEQGEEGKKPAGDLTHTPVAEQAVNTPVPVYIEISEDTGATKVTLRYKPFGAKKWKSVEMPRVGDGYGVEIPCEDVTTTGDVKYYIVAKDDAGDPVGTAGSLKAPHKVPIKNEIDDSPSLPGQKPPQKCAAKEDCPPGLPGCPGATGKPWGASCEEASECESGLTCLNGTCEQGEEKPSGTGGKKNLVGAWGQFDLLLISGKESGVCSGGEGNDSYVCFYPEDSEYGTGQFYGKPKDVGGTNGIQGGFGLAGARALLSFDRELDFLVPGLMAGLRVGYAFGGSPSSDKKPPNNQHTQAKGFLPIHAEGRIGFMIPLGGKGLLEPMKPHPYVFVGGGLAQVNAAVPVSVCDTLEPDGKNPVGTGASTCSKGGSEPARIVKEIDAYQITGLNFAAVGAGATFGITPNVGVAAELKVMFMVPTFGVVFAPNIGPVFAF